MLKINRYYIFENRILNTFFNILSYPHEWFSYFVTAVINCIQYPYEKLWSTIDKYGKNKAKEITKFEMQRVTEREFQSAYDKATKYYNYSLISLVVISWAVFSYSIEVISLNYRFKGCLYSAPIFYASLLIFGKVGQTSFNIKRVHILGASTYLFIVLWWITKIIT